MSKTFTKNLAVGVVALGAIAICAVGYRYARQQQINQQVAYAKSAVKNEKKQLAEAETTIQTFYQDSQGGILSPAATAEAIETVTNQLGGIQTTADAFGINENQVPSGIKKLDQTKQALQEQLRIIKEKQSLQKKIATLYEQPLNWTTYADPGAIQQKLTVAAIGELKERVNLVSKDNWQTLANQYVTTASQQQTEVTAIQTTLDKMYQDGTVTDAANLDEYSTLVTAIDAVKNQTIRQTFVQSLNAINDQMGFGMPAQ